jgi:hypothetical protein
MDNELVKKLAIEIIEMKEVADDPNATPEMRSNANSYIRGIRKAIEIIEGV